MAQNNKLSGSKKRDKNPFFGKKHREETRNKMSESAKKHSQGKDYAFGGALPCEVEGQYYVNYQAAGEANENVDKTVSGRRMKNWKFPPWIPLPKGTTWEEWMKLSLEQKLFFKENACLVGDQNRAREAARVRMRRAEAKVANSQEKKEKN